MGESGVCVEFTDLNKACPKDNFPLPKIDLIVDATSKHELLSFMDAFSGYHQIKMHPLNVENTSFIIERIVLLQDHAFLVEKYRGDIL